MAMTYRMSDEQLDAVRRGARENPIHLDGYREKRVKQILVSEYDAAFDRDPDLLVQLEAFTGEEIVRGYSEEFARYSTTPMDPAGERLRLYPGCVTIWSGFPGTGKTTLLRQLACHLLQSGNNVFFASLEENPKHLLVRLAGTAAGCAMPAGSQMQRFLDLYAKQLWLWGRIGMAEHRKLLAMIRALADLGVTHAIVDSLMCLDISNDDFEAQRKFANLLAASARASKVHIHLVAHPRKLISSDQEPDINDVAGAREIGGIADNVLFVRRAPGDETPSATTTAMKICVRKQRHFTGALGDIDGFFHRAWKQFSTEQFPASPARYLTEYVDPETGVCF